MVLRRPPRAFLTVAVTAALAGCVDSIAPVCTQIGCESGVRIELAEPLPEGATVTLASDRPGGVAVSFQCTAASPCESPLFARDFTPESLTVRIQGGGIDYSESFIPTYTASRPNGPNCPPECRNATIVVDPG